jgi:hypothetical protein
LKLYPGVFEIHSDLLYQMMENYLRLKMHMTSVGVGRCGVRVTSFGKFSKAFGMGGQIILQVSGWSVMKSSSRLQKKQ